MNSAPPKKNTNVLARLSPPFANLVTRGLSLLAGIGVALIFYYLFYRVQLPSKPFIYVAF